MTNTYDPRLDERKRYGTDLSYWEDRIRECPHNGQVPTFGDCKCTSDCACRGYTCFVATPPGLPIPGEFWQVRHVTDGSWRWRGSVTLVQNASIGYRKSPTLLRQHRVFFIEGFSLIFEHPDLVWERVRQTPREQEDIKDLLQQYPGTVNFGVKVPITIRQTPRERAQHAWDNWTQEDINAELKAATSMEDLLQQSPGTVTLTLTVSSQVADLLEQLQALGIYGRTVEDVAERLIEQALQELVEPPVLQIPEK